MQEFDEIWSLTLEELRQVYSETVMSLWIKDIRLARLTDSQAVMYVPSEFKRGILEKNHSKAISRSLESVLGYSVSLVFSSNESEAFAEDKQAYSEISDEPEQIDITYIEKEEAAKSLEEQTETAYFGAPSAPVGVNTGDYTFENFIVGASNKFVHAVCRSVAKQPAPAWVSSGNNSGLPTSNPLFIYGPSGLGKTHLLHAMINEIKMNFPHYNVIYVKGDEFTNQMIESIAKGTTAEFREKFRQADVILIDDIHFIAGRESTQEEFFHTFNNLYEHNKQIILTSDRPAKDIAKLEERLRTRFEWGMLADIQPPDFELRVAIMGKKAERLGKNLSIEVLNFLAEKLTNNVRQMEGAIKRIIAYSHLNGEEITIAMVNECISDLLVNNGVIKITPEKIVEKISEKYGVTKGEIYSKARTGKVAKARHICVYLMKKQLDLSYKAIGDALGGRDHSTIMHSYDQIEQEIKNNSAFELEINEIISAF